MTPSNANGPRRGARAVFRRPAEAGRDQAATAIGCGATGTRSAIFATAASRVMFSTAAISTARRSSAASKIWRSEKLRSGLFTLRPRSRSTSATVGGESLELVHFAFGVGRLLLRVPRAKVIANGIRRLAGGELIAEALAVLSTGQAADAVGDHLGARHAQQQATLAEGEVDQFQALPANGRRGFAGDAAHTMGGVHHRIALREAAALGQRQVAGGGLGGAGGFGAG